MKLYLALLLVLHCDIFNSILFYFVSVNLQPTKLIFKIQYQDVEFLMENILFLLLFLN